MVQRVAEQLTNLVDGLAAVMQRVGLDLLDGLTGVDQHWLSATGRCASVARGHSVLWMLAATPAFLEQAAPHVAEQLRQVCGEARGGGAVDDAMVVD